MIIKSIKSENGIIEVVSDEGIGKSKGEVIIHNSKDININCVDERVKTNGSGNGDILVGKRFGLFLNEGLMGFLDFYGDNGAGEIWYAGKVLGNGFVRMIYEAGEDVRVDNWDIPFP